MKRTKQYKTETTRALRAKLAMYQHIMGVMLVRLGGEVTIPQEELERMEGARVDFNATPQGVWMKTDIIFPTPNRIIIPNGLG